MNVKDCKRLKIIFFIQSFAPLFFVLWIKHFDINGLFLLCRFLSKLLKGDLTVFLRIFAHSETWGFIASCVCFFWVLITILYAFLFRNLQTAGFSSTGDTISSIEIHKDVGLNFFASYLLPLIVDVDGLQSFAVFVGMLFLILTLVWKSDLFYENPILSLWNYKTFSFTTNSGLTGIGITRGIIDTNSRIKTKRIGDGLFFIYNESK